MCLSQRKSGGGCCVAMDKFSEVGLCAGAWRIEALSHWQNCVEEVALDGGFQSGDNPQNGQ